VIPKFFYISLRLMPILNSIIAIFVIRSIVSVKNDDLIAFVFFFPLLFEIFKFGYQMYFWSSGDSFYDSKFLDIICLSISVLSFIIWITTDNIYYYIVALGLAGALLGKLSDLFRQVDKRSFIVVFDSAIILIFVCLNFNSFYLVSCYGLVVGLFIINRVFLVSPDISTGTIDFNASRRFVFLAMTNTGLLSQLLFFYLFSNHVSLEFIFILRLLTGSASLSAYYVRFFPSDSLKSNRTFIGNFISALGVGAVLLYLIVFDYALLRENLILISIFSVYQSLRYTITRNSHLISGCNNKILITRSLISLSIIVIGNFIFILTESIYLPQLILPLSYVATMMIDFYFLRDLK